MLVIVHDYLTELTSILLYIHGSLPFLVNPFYSIISPHPQQCKVQPSSNHDIPFLDFILIIQLRGVSSQSPGATPQLASPRVHQRRNPLIVDIATDHLVSLSQIRRRAQQGRLEVDVNALPVFLVHLEDFVVDADVVDLLDYLVPPVPSLAVHGTVRELVNVLGRPPVRDDQVFGCSVGGLVLPRRSTVVTGPRGILLEILDHLVKVASDRRGFWGQKTHGVVRLEPQQEHDHFFGRRFLVKVTVFVRDLRRGSSVDGPLEVRILLESVRDGEGVDETSAQDEDRRQHGVEAGDDKDDEGL